MAFVGLSIAETSFIAAAQIVINPAAGPFILRGDTLENKLVIRPPIIAVKIPITAGNPLALAIPKLSGSANKKTKKPAYKSFLK